MLALPKLLPLSEVQTRLEMIFPDSYPDRAILVGVMSVRAIYVSLYGGFVQGADRFFRPSTIIRFTYEQTEETSDEARATWLASCQAPGHKPVGQRWYMDNTREPLRDDYLRNRAIPIGIFARRDGVPPSSPAPIYSLSKKFAEIFDPALQGTALDEAIEFWKDQNLNPLTLKRMRLSASGVFAREGEMEVRLPNTGQTFRLPVGEASVITKDVCEVLAWRIAERPIVVHVSMSDIKMRPELARNAEIVGLQIDQKAELPDIVIADVPHAGGLSLTFIEVVHSDGPVTELRKTALLEIARKAGVPSKHVNIITAFEDRNIPIFKKRVSELAIGSAVWFRTEPDMLMDIAKLSLRQ